MSSTSTGKSDELKKRVITALIGAGAVVLLLVFGGRPGAALLAAVLSVAMLYEFSNLFFTLSDRFEKRALLAGVGWLVAFVNFWIPRVEYELLLISFVGLFAYFLFTAERHPGEGFKTHFQELMYSIFGMLYLGFLPLFLPLIRDSASGKHWVLLFLLIIWCVDIGAYFAGMKFGRRKLYAAISPKKTIEGAVGGMAAGIILAVLYKLLFFQSLGWSSAILISMVLGVFSQVGDLAESFMKRAAQVKDSGTILPGHGGFLDRFDGVVFALPVMYGCIRIFG